MKTKIILLVLVCFILALYFTTKDYKSKDLYIPTDEATSTPILINVSLDELGITFELPEGWTIGQTNLKNAWVIDSPEDGFLGVVIQPEGYYYHNASATSLEDYATSYRSSWDLQIVVDHSEPVKIDGEPALFQMFRAGDSYINGVLDTTSLASVYGPSPRYVVQHPESKEFIIIRGNSLNLNVLNSFIEKMKFIKK